MGIIKEAYSYWKSHRHLDLLLVFLLAFAPYANIYGNQLLWDDTTLIEHNMLIRDVSNIPKLFSSSIGEGVGRIDHLYRPIQMLSYTLIYQVAGIDAWAYHLFDVFLHAVNAILLLLLVRMLTGKRNVAFLAAVLWVVHPVHTEAITYTTATADPLVLLFMLSSVIMYLKFKESGKKLFITASCGFFALALLSKETALALPLIIAAYEFASDRGKIMLKHYKWVLIFLAIAGIYLLVRFTVLNFGGGFVLQPDWEYKQNVNMRILTFLAALPTYYSLLALPVNLHMERNFPPVGSPLDPAVLISVVMLGLFAYLVKKDLGRKAKGFPAAAFGIMWFFMAFVPTSGIIPVNSLLLEHWLYTPSVGIFMALSITVCALWEKKPKVRPYIALAVIALLAASVSLALDRNEDWKDAITFYNNIIGHTGGNVRIWMNLGIEYDETGEYGLAEQCYMKSLSFDPHSPIVNYNIGVFYLTRGQGFFAAGNLEESDRYLETAIGYFKASIESDPTFGPSYQNLRDIYAGIGDNETAGQYAALAEKYTYYREI